MGKPLPLQISRGMSVLSRDVSPAHSPRVAPWLKADANVPAFISFFFFFYFTFISLHSWRSVMNEPNDSGGGPQNTFWPLLKNLMTWLDSHKNYSSEKFHLWIVNSKKISSIAGNVLVFKSFYFSGVQNVTCGRYGLKIWTPFQGWGASYWH